jgi:hypothetical protein
MTLRSWIVCGLALVSSACAERELGRAEPETCAEEQRHVPITSNRSLDILFVVDDSGSMGEEQSSLATNFHRFVSVLENLNGGLPNLHIGVVSTDAGAGPFAITGCSGDGDDGMLSVPSTCAGPTDAYLEDVAVAGGTRQQNYAGSLADTFACMAQIGTRGCGFEQPLEAMKRALDGRNPGFLRPDAYLLVVIITDEDDCSASDTALFDPSNGALGPLSSFRCFEQGVRCDPDQARTPGVKAACEPRSGSPYAAEVAAYADFLRGLKPDPTQVMVAGIFGDPDSVEVELDQGGPVLAPSCTSPSGRADPPVRLASFLERFPQRNTRTSICNEDLSEALELIALRAQSLAGPPCLQGELDQDPQMPGLQYDCVMTEVFGLNTDQHEERIMPACSQLPPAPAELPCWHFEPNEVSCGDTPTGMAVVFERGGEDIPAGTSVLLRCLDSCQ